jgi:hypothetical protein
MPENYCVHLGNSMERKLSQSLVLTTLTSLSLIFGTLGLSAKANTPANTQNFTISNAEITNYAESVLEMEPNRQKAFEEIKKLIGAKEIPKIVCNDSQSMNALPGKAKDIAINYCNDSQKIVSENSLTIDRFNQITLELQSNNDLKRKIYNTLIRLQNEAAAKAGARNGR